MSESVDADRGPRRDACRRIRMRGMIPGTRHEIDRGRKRVRRAAKRRRKSGLA